MVQLEDVTNFSNQSEKVDVEMIRKQLNRFLNRDLLSTINTVHTVAGSFGILDLVMTVVHLYVRSFTHL